MHQPFDGDPLRGRAGVPDRKRRIARVARGVGAAAIVGLLVAPGAVAGAPDRTHLLTRCGAVCEGLRARIREEKRAAFVRVADERLLADVMPPEEGSRGREENPPSPEVPSAPGDAVEPSANGSEATAAEARVRRARRVSSAAREQALAAARASTTVRPAFPDEDPRWEETTPGLVVGHVGRSPVENHLVEEDRALILHRLRGSLHRELQRQLRAWREDEAWRRAAVEAGVSTERLRERIRSGASPVSEGDVRRWLEDQPAAADGADEATRLARGRDYLEHQRRRAAERAFLAVRMKNLEAPKLDEPERGYRSLDTNLVLPLLPIAAEAPVSLVFVADLVSDSSRAVAEIVGELADSGETWIGVAPLVVDDDAPSLARAVRLHCALEGGVGARALTADYGASRDDYARALGVDVARFGACVSRVASIERVFAASDAARRAELVTAPAIWIDGRVLGGRQRRTTIRRSLADARAGGRRRAARVGQ